jgi:hypothetical protein
MTVNIGQDCLPVVYSHLRRLGPFTGDGLDLFVITRGGDIMVPLPIHNLLREFASRVNVIVPAECHSAGTMIALGADEIVMGPYGQLSPIDPTVTHPLNPQAPIISSPPQISDKLQLMGIGVEQVFAYMTLARDKAGISEQEFLTRVFERLSEKVHPIALGEIHRVHSLIRILAEKLLRLHTDDKDSINTTVEALSEKLFSHGYLIGRKEARTVFNLPVTDTSGALEAAMLDLRDTYVTDAKMDQPFDLNAELAQVQLTPPGTNQWPKRGRWTLEAGYIGSSAGESIYMVEINVTLANQGAQPNVNVSGKWESTWQPAATPAAPVAPPPGASSVPQR